MTLYLVKARKPKEHIMKEIGLCRADQIEQVKTRFLIENDLMEDGKPVAGVAFKEVPFAMDEENNAVMVEKETVADMETENTSEEDRFFSDADKKASSAQLYVAVKEYLEMDMNEIKNDIREVSNALGQERLAELTGISFSSIVSYKRKGSSRPPFESYVNIMRFK